MMIKGRPPRLEQIFQTYDPPLYFVTICTIHRQKIGDLEAATSRIRSLSRRARYEFGVGVGRYLIMPDHMHLFVRCGDDFKLTQWVNGLKRAISVPLGATKKRPLWQPGFFDHILRNDESYSQKWEYVGENPVRGPSAASRIKANSCSSIGHSRRGRHGRLYTGMVMRNRLVSGASGFSCRSPK